MNNFLKEDHEFHSVNIMIGKADQNGSDQPDYMDFQDEDHYEDEDYYDEEDNCEGGSYEKMGAERVVQIQISHPMIIRMRISTTMANTQMVTKSMVSCTPNRKLRSSSCGFTALSLHSTKA